MAYAETPQMERTLMMEWMLTVYSVEAIGMGHRVCLVGRGSKLLVVIMTTVTMNMEIML